jgi:Tol biopolymer transport system component
MLRLISTLGILLTLSVTMLMAGLVALAREEAALGGGTGWLAYTSREGSLHLMQAVGGVDRLLLAAPPVVSAPAWSPDGRAIAAVITRNAVGWLMLIDPVDRRPRYPLQTPFGIRNPVWSPDGSQLAFNSDLDGEADVYIWTLATNRLEQRTRAVTPEYPLAWSPDGAQIAIASNQAGPFKLYGLVGDQEYPLMESNADDYDLDWSPDGAHIVFASNRTGSGDLYLWSGADSIPRRLTATRYSDNPFDWSPDGRLIAFTSGERLRRTIYLLDLASWLVVPLVDGTDPSWQPAVSD